MYDHALKGHAGKKKRKWLIFFLFPNDEFGSLAYVGQNFLRDFVYTCILPFPRYRPNFLYLSLILYVTISLTFSISSVLLSIYFSLYFSLSVYISYFLFVSISLIRSLWLLLSTFFLLSLFLFFSNTHSFPSFLPAVVCLVHSFPILLRFLSSISFYTHTCMCMYINVYMCV